MKKNKDSGGDQGEEAAAGVPTEEKSLNGYVDEEDDSMFKPTSCKRKVQLGCLRSESERLREEDIGEGDLLDSKGDRFIGLGNVVAGGHKPKLAKELRSLGPLKSSSKQSKMNVIKKRSGGLSPFLAK
ncbi:hypothetical protein MA16_Dca025056 [Dendrobium catenatum]|uniref:Uncharacterized protein n=1 Tax=Dendrobium catenatum TaxID=906689 RepID=A0A2I0VF82_9ASPA|nr:hypothetical protein MA16_Dca025056 [Dendrobium catenatum]